MVDPIPMYVKELFDAWSFRCTLIFSLSIQTFLMFFASHRKRTSRKFFLFLIWSAYLLADWSANFAAGQASNSRGDDPKPGDPPENNELLAFWVSFLLLHLGGPDTITTLALEDNELWLRQLLSLGFQAIATAYVFLQSLPNSLWKPMILVFSTGVIKYTERTLAMYLASHDKFKESMIREPFPNYGKLMEEYVAKKNMKLATHTTENEKPKPDAEVRLKKLTHLNILQYAYKYFNIFKGLVVDLIFTSNESKMFFNSLTSEEALRVLEVELNFIFDALFTKAEILHNWIGASFRVIALGCLIAALCIFQEKNKDQYGGFEVGLTYALLICGITLDSIALIMFSLSDWMFVRVRKLKEEVEEEMEDQNKVNCFDSCLNWFLSFRELKWKEYQCSKKMELPKEKQYRRSHKVLDRKFIFRRWSEYVHAHNLIEYSLRISSKKMHHTKGWIHSCVDWLIEILYIGPLFRGIGQAIASCFEAIKETSHQIYKCIDDYIDRWCMKHKVDEYDFRRCIYRIFFILCLPYYLIKKSMDFFGVQAHLDEFIFTSSDRLTLDLWEHIFTEVKNKSRFAVDSESTMRVSSARGDWTLRDIQGDGEEKEKTLENLLFYVMEMDYDESLVVWHIATELLYQTQEGTEDNHSDREFSKIISDYMIYLLMMQPTLMSAVTGIGQIMFRDTCEEAKRFFKKRHLQKRNAKLASNEILSVTVPGKAERAQLQGHKSKSVLFDGSLLAQELQGLSKDGGEAEMWKVVSKVWVELLSYAATNCDAIEHAAQLCKGGELISFVWLLMAHFGLGDSPRSTRR